MYRLVKEEIKRRAKEVSISDLEEMWNN
jgi:hypothetical protein